MSTKPVSQLDAAGHFVCLTLADESPLEPGVWLLPAMTVDALPPGTYEPAEMPGAMGVFTPDWPAGEWPRWNGSAFGLVTWQPPEPGVIAEPDPVAKLQAFLVANPDVAALLQQGGV
jgi:hypothetical protein